MSATHSAGQRRRYETTTLEQRQAQTAKGRQKAAERWAVVEEFAERLQAVEAALAELRERVAA